MAENTFRGYQLETNNHGIFAMCEEIINFRKQLTVRDEMKSQSGWGDTFNNFLIGRFERLADTLESVTYNPGPETQEQLEANAADTSRSVLSDYSANSVNTDNVLMPAGREVKFRWDLTGADPDIPQLTVVTCPNDWMYNLITGLDSLFTEITRLDSRFQKSYITKYESVMIRAKINELVTITQRKGGEVNRNDVPTGTLPSQEPGTLQAP